MATTKIAISIDSNLLSRLDKILELRVFKNRDQAIQSAICHELERFEHTRLTKECANLDIHFEQQFAEGLPEDFSRW